MKETNNVTKSVNEEILIGDNIYCCEIYNKNKSRTKCAEMYLLKTEINGKTIMKSFDDCATTYEINYSENNKPHAILISKINDLLAKENLDYYIKDVYDRYTFERARLALCHKEFFEYDPEIEKPIQVAVNWWAKALSNPSFDELDTSDIGRMITLALTLINEDKPTIQDDEIERFKINLGHEIRMRLQNREYNFTLEVDYMPDIALTEAAEAAKLDVSHFPIKTFMRLSKDEISVQAGSYSKREILYDAKESKNTIAEEKIKVLKP
jgi:hypothetical protein